MWPLSAALTKSAVMVNCSSCFYFFSSAKKPQRTAEEAFKKAWPKASSLKANPLKDLCMKLLPWNLSSAL